MTRTERINGISTMVTGISESLSSYEEASKRTKCGHPYAGCDLKLEDSRESIRRRITVVREELLRLYKSL